MHMPIGIANQIVFFNLSNVYVNTGSAKSQREIIIEVGHRPVLYDEKPGPE